MNGDTVVATTDLSIQAGPAQSHSNGASITQETCPAPPAPRICSRCKKAPARPKQWYCRPCHNAQMKRSRGRYRSEVTRLKKLIDNMTIRNAATLRHFEEKVGRTRRVIVTTDDGSRIRCSGD